MRALFLDISKAFDKVWYRGLLHKLNYVGIRGRLLDWFSNYLTNRRQTVVLPGSFSDWSYLKAGISQGLILSPLLFLIFINDINSNTRLFADDNSLYIIIDTPQKILHLLWTTAFQNLNPAKSESLLITRRRANLRHSQMILNNQPIENVTSHKHLSLVLSNDGIWHNHIELITSKAWSRINIMRKLKFQFDRKTLEILYFTFIRPILE